MKRRVADAATTVSAAAPRNIAQTNTHRAREDRPMLRTPLRTLAAERSRRRMNSNFVTGVGRRERWWTIQERLNRLSILFRLPILFTIHLIGFMSSHCPGTPSSQFEVPITGKRSVSRCLASLAFRAAVHRSQQPARVSETAGVVVDRRVVWRRTHRLVGCLRGDVWPRARSWRATESESEQESVRQGMQHQSVAP
jgi:hypothetical protein